MLSTSWVPYIIQDYRRFAQTRVLSPGVQRWQEKGLALEAYHMRCVLICSVLSESLRLHGEQSVRLLCPWDSPGKSAAKWLPSPPPGGLPDPGMEPTSPAAPALAGGFFITERLLCLLHCRWILYHEHHLGSPHEVGQENILVPLFLFPLGICHFKGQVARSSGP